MKTFKITIFHVTFYEIKKVRHEFANAISSDPSEVKTGIENKKQDLDPSQLRKFYNVSL